MHRPLKSEAILPVLSLYGDGGYAILVLYCSSFIIKDTACARTDGAGSGHFVVHHWIFSIFCGSDDYLSFSRSYDDDPDQLSNARRDENWSDVPHAVCFNQ